MALADEVSNRIPAKRLIELTNPDSAAASSVNTTILSYAVLDAQTDFKIYAGQTYDNTDTNHVALAVEGVIIRLHKYNGQWSDAMVRADERWIAKLKQYSISLGANSRLAPVTTSELQESTDSRGNSGTFRPRFDDRIFDRTKPNRPGSGGTSSGEDDVSSPS